MRHQYISRTDSQILTEHLFCDRIISYLYSSVRENSPAMYKAVTSARMSSLLGFLNYDLPLGGRITGGERLVGKMGIDLSECVLPASAYTTPRAIFERQIRYRETRPMPESRHSVVSPADSRMLIGSLAEESHLFIKDKFFAFEELLGRQSRQWIERFRSGEFAIFRLTPEKYHHNHAPVTGRVVDIYTVEGAFHSCNPSAVIAECTPFSKNRRVVTVLDTDIPGGTGCGLVAMVEVVALMIGRIVQCYSESGYDDPKEVRSGMILRKGQPKSLYRPGSSLDILLFEPGRITFSPDLQSNQRRLDVHSRFSRFFEQPMVETDIRVRAEIATANRTGPASPIQNNHPATSATL